MVIWIQIQKYGVKVSLFQIDWKRNKICCEHWCLTFQYSSLSANQLLVLNCRLLPIKTRDHSQTSMKKTQVPTIWIRFKLS